jgi:hypothetical protein
MWRMTHVSAPVSPRRHRDFVLVGLVAIGVMAAYVAVERGEIVTWDGQSMASVGQNLLQHHSLKECCNAYGAFPKDPGPYAKFGIGFSLLLAPLWHFQLSTNPNNAVWLGLANPLLLTATTVVILKTGRVLGWRRSSATLAALAFALLTMAPLYSTEFFAEPGVTFGAALLMLGFALWEQRRASGPFVIGLGTAIAILFRPDSIILIGPVVPLMVLFRSRDDLVATWRAWAPRVGLPIGLAVGWTLYFDELRYGNPFQVGYSRFYDTQGFSTPVFRGVALLMVSPGKSFFVYSPILLGAIPGIVWLARRGMPLAVVIVAMCTLRVVFYARWWTPQGGNSWGPRFLLPLCAVLAIPLGVVFEHLHGLGRRERRAAIGALGVLTAASVAVELSSLLVSYKDMFLVIYNVNAFPVRLHAAVIRQREHRYFWTFGGNQVVWNLRHIGSTQVHSPLHWFHNGATAFGVGMLALAVICCACAVAVAFGSDRPDGGGATTRDGADAPRPGER